MYVGPSPITLDDVALWPHSVSILLECSSFLATLHCPQDAAEKGKCGISYFELLIMFETQVGHRLICEKAVRSHLRPRRPRVHSSFLACIGHEIRHRCQFPCQPSAHYTRLLHVGWGQCGHGLSSRPRESCDIQVVKPLLDFFGYPEGAATELYSGNFKLRCFSVPFSKRFPSWPVPNLTSSTLAVGTSPGPRFHFPDRDPVHELPAKRFRITGKSSADKRACVSIGDLPTP